ncbi:type VI secretion system protein [Azospirillum rugosum]|uniref:Type VI secretion system protein ImpL n=1 Tax=Azospirillum rugosum TaxID=416170 RepID=A0ABS4SU33_9PROT|nr:type VI secretion system protein [Azospirillum rugosum]MBP2296073.1 type VI secretion system protein ImpL [Azospirillum rugosum]MDQ0530754.1 type VI secretion system protein ImpL [Azospirillum rugosum]
MVLLMLAVELLFSSIGAAIAAIASFAVFILPYALAALPLYILYRVVRARWPKLTRRFRRAPKAKPSIRQAAATHRPRPATTLQVRAEAPPSARAANDTLPLARVYGEGLDILKRQMRGPLLRGEIPWFLAFGVGGPALLATDPTHVRWPEDGNGEFGAWWFCEGAAILHAGTDSSDGAKLSESWPSLASAMRARPMRRPLDGILMMVGADELRAAAEREAPRSALAKRAAALRERLRSLRDDLGVVCPVHVVVVRAEALDGFAELCATVPSAMLDSVLGWTNRQDWTLPFDPRRVDEAFDSLRADLALLEADALAAGTAGIRLPLLPASLETLRHPLALFLDGALGGEEGAEPFPLRGIALTGTHTTITGGRRPAFARDLLPGRAFAESGYGRPSEAAFLRARTRRRQAQGALAASVVGLSLAAWQGVSGVSAGVPAVAGATDDLRRALLSRDAAPDAETVGRVIAATVRMERDRLATPLLPTSLLSGFDEDKRRLASVTVRRAVLRPIRDALLPSPVLADLPPAADARQVEDLPSFRRLAAQFDRIGGRRDALERYDRFRRSSGFDELLAVSESVFGAVPKPATVATDGFITRIAAGADLPNLDARTIAAAVRAESVRLATPLAEDLYARNPLRVRAQALADRLRDLPQPPSADDVAEIRRLVEAVTDAAGWPIAAALRAPSHGLPDAVKVALQKAAIAELPGRDPVDRITEALATAATDSRAALAALEAPPVGRLFTLPDDGGNPVPVPALAELPTVLAALVLPEPVAAPVAEPPAKAEPVKAEAPAPEPAKPAPAPPKPVAEVPAPAPIVPPPPPVRAVTAPAVAMLPAPTVPAVPDGEAAVAKLAAGFSQTLAGRFPFVRADLARGAPDADPQDVRRFYQSLDENRSALARHASAELTGFLEKMEAARPLLEAVAKAAPVSVSLAYGVNRGQEIGAEHIIDWSVRTGASAVGAAADAEPLVWKAGQPVLLSFRWAAGSPYRPKSAAANAAEAAAGDTLTLVERGPWALLRLLKGRTAGSGAGRDGSVLRIALPTQTIGGAPARDTVLFMAASVRVGGRPSAPLALPDLPARFPSW